MKGIGKGSIASLLSAGLHVARVIIFICFVGLAIAAAVLLSAPLLSSLIGDSPHFVIDGGDTAPKLIEVLYYFVAFGVMLYIVNRLLEILRTLRFGTPFVKENAVRFQRVGFALLFGEGVKIVFGVVAAAVGAKLGLKVELFAWIGIAAVFVLAEVFHEGAKMKEEQDLTV